MATGIVTKDGKGAQHHYVCPCGRRHTHRTSDTRPDSVHRRCKCGGNAAYRYSNFVGDPKDLVRATYSFTDPHITEAPPSPPRQDLGLPAGVLRRSAPATGFAGPRPIERLDARAQRRHNAEVAALNPPDKIKWVKGTPAEELRYALDLLDEVFSFDKGMPEEEWVAFCNRNLPFLKAHGRQKYVAGYS